MMLLRSENPFMCWWKWLLRALCTQVNHLCSVRSHHYTKQSQKHIYAITFIKPKNDAWNVDACTPIFIFKSIYQLHDRLGNSPAARNLTNFMATVNMLKFGMAEIYDLHKHFFPHLDAPSTPSWTLARLICRLPTITLKSKLLHSLVAAAWRLSDPLARYYRLRITIVQPTALLWLWCPLPGFDWQGIRLTRPWSRFKGKWKSDLQWIKTMI